MTNVKRRRRPDGKNVIMNVPENTAIITKKNFESSISFNNRGEAYIKLGSYKGNGMIEEPASCNLQDVDTQLIRTLYAIFYEKYEKNDYILDFHELEIYIPEFQKKLGQKVQPARILNSSDVETDGEQQYTARLLNDIKNIQNNVTGVIKSPYCDYEEYYAVLTWNGSIEETNTIILGMPYIEHLILHMKECKERESKKHYGKEVIHSYLIKTAIDGEKNKAAVENVVIITTLIEQAGNGEPHIRARTLIERNEVLKAQLERSAPKHKQRVLDRCFSKTYELLDTMTTIKEHYNGISFPMELPRYSNLDVVLRFPHKGKLL